MAALLEEYDATFDRGEFPDCKVMAVADNGRFASWPDWLLQYRRPDVDAVNAIRYKPCEYCGKLAHECPCIDEAIAAASSQT